MIQKVIGYIPRMWKAIMAGVGTAGATYGALQVDGMTWGEWGYLVGTVIPVMLATWKVSNAPAPAPGNALDGP